MGEKKGVPDWQSQSQPDADGEPVQSESAAVDLAPESESESEPSSEDASSRQNLLEQARTFLDHDEIKDASTESKISFLEEKGLTNDEIHDVLGISRNETTAPEPAADVVQHTQREVATSQTAGSSSSSPPIITYPEFLLHASKPPPLITPTRVLNALYAGSVVGATIYGASKFVLQPMFDRLSGARHDLFSSTKEQLEPLNKKLEEVVSQVPVAARVHNVGHERRIPQRGDDDDDESSIASDPTEMFHRDIGVQTDAPDSLDSAAADGKNMSPTATAEKLSTLKEHLHHLLHSSSMSLNATEKAKTELKETEVYLDQLRYGSGGTGYGGGDDAWRGQIFGSKVAGANKKVDAVEEFKSDIRAMKGTLLSARNFPRGGGTAAR